MNLNYLTYLNTLNYIKCWFKLNFHFVQQIDTINAFLKEGKNQLILGVLKPINQTNPWKASIASRVS